MGQNPGGMSYAYKTRIEHDGNGDRIKRLVQIVPAEAQVVNFIMTEYVAGRSPGAIAKELNSRGEPAPRSAKRKVGVIAKPAMWGGNTITGNAARGTGILNNILYIGQRSFETLQLVAKHLGGHGKRHLHAIGDERCPNIPEVFVARGKLDGVGKPTDAQDAQHDSFPIGCSQPIFPGAAYHQFQSLPG